MDPIQIYFQLAHRVVVIWSPDFNLQAPGWLVKVRSEAKADSTPTILIRLDSEDQRRFV
jgi:hypothetical protein